MKTVDGLLTSLAGGEDVEKILDEVAEFRGEKDIPGVEELVNNLAGGKDLLEALDETAQVVQLHRDLESKRKVPSTAHSLLVNALASGGTLTFAPGETSKTITVLGAGGDYTVESGNNLVNTLGGTKGDQRLRARAKITSHFRIPSSGHLYPEIGDFRMGTNLKE